MVHSYIWAGPQHFLHECMCAQRQLKSACAGWWFFAGRSVGRQGSNVSSDGQQGLWSACASAQSSLDAHAVLWEKLCPGSTVNCFISFLHGTKLTSDRARRIPVPFCAEVRHRRTSLTKHRVCQHGYTVHLYKYGRMPYPHDLDTTIL